jgi:hypothetical protein
MVNASHFRLAVLLLSVVPLVGCWNTDKQVFSASEGDPLPGAVYLEQRGATNSGSPMHLSQVSGTNDFAFSIDGIGPPGCASNKGTFRAIHIKDDIYVLQIVCEGEDGYRIQFYRITNGSYDTVAPVASDLGEARLVHYNVNDDKGELSGDPSDINAYLRSLKDTDFQSSND